MYSRFIIVLATFISSGYFYSGKANSQVLTEKDDFNKDFIKTYSGYITGRLYGSKKFTRLTLLDGDKDRTLNFRPNIGYNFGVGATYSLFTLNIGVGAQWFAPTEKGDTDYLDLQSHFYSRKLTIDLVAQFYDSFYSNPSDGLYDTSGDFYVRPDLNMRVIGLSSFYLFNHKKFSYRAALVQNERQKKSAGSALVGFEVYHIRWKADSSLIPLDTLSSGFYSGTPVKRSFNFQIGPSGGYAHTFVFKENFFVTLSLTANMAFEVISDYSETDQLDRKTGFFPNLISRAVAGYNSDKWFIGVSHVNTYISANRNNGNEGYLVQSGNFRFNIAKRFMPNKKTKKYLDVIDKGEKMITP